MSAVPPGPGAGVYRVCAATCESAARGQTRSRAAVPRCRRVVRVGPTVEQIVPCQRCAQVGGLRRAHGETGRRDRRWGGGGGRRRLRGRADRGWVRPPARSKAAAATAASQSVRLSSGTDVSPDASIPPTARARRAGPSAS